MPLCNDPGRFPPLVRGRPDYGSATYEGISTWLTTMMTPLLW
jgi:hypothetical protein